MSPSISSSLTLYAITVSTEICIVIWFCSEPNTVNLNGRQFCRISGTKHVAVNRTVVKSRGNRTFNLTKATTTIETTSYGATRQVGSNVSCGCSRETDIIHKDTRYVGNVTRHWQELVTELGGNTTVRIIVALFVVCVQPCVPRSMVTCIFIVMGKVHNIVMVPRCLTAI